MVYEQYRGSGKFSPQQLHIMDQKKKSDKLREKEAPKLNENAVKSDWSKGKIKGYKLPKSGDFEAISFYNNEKLILELRVSGTAIVNQPCGLKEKNIHEWLWNSGIEFIKEVKEPHTLMITSYDVVNGVLTTDWKNLRREEASE